MKLGVVSTAPAPEKRRPSQTRESECTCTIRTRLSSLAELIRAMPMLVREDGKLFIPANEAPVQVGDSVKVVFTTFDGAASIDRGAVVESTSPDAAYFGGQPGILFRMLPWDPPPTGPEPEIPPEPAPEDDEIRNPFVGLDTHMLSLFVDCNLKETDTELSRSYDDIPSYVAPAAAAPPEPPPAATSGAETVEVVPIPDVEAEVEAEVDAPVEAAPRDREAESDAAIEAAPGDGVEMPIVSEPFDPAPDDWVYQPPRRIPRIGWLVVATAVAASVASAVMFLNLPATAPRNPPRNPVAMPTPAPPIAPVVAAPQAPQAEAPPPTAESATPTAEVLMPTAAPAVAAATARCRVKVVSEPSGADVLLAGRSLGHTPTTPLEVPCGASLTIKRPRYQTVATLVPTEPSDGVREIAAHLERPAAMLEVTSEPSGANVVMHGRTVGQTPAVLTVFEYDSFQFELQAAGFAPLRKQMYLRTTSARFHGELVPDSDSAAEPTTP